MLSAFAALPLTVSLSPIVVGLAVYVLLQVGVGAYIAARGQVKTEDDFFVAGRRLPTALVAFSVFATWFGAETCVGAAGAVHAEGLHLATVEPFAYGLCLVLSGLLLAAPLWRMGITTLGDLFRQRFGPGVERLAAVVLLPSSVLWAAAQIRAFGQVLVASDIGLDLVTAIAVAAVVAVVYTVLGGLLADVYTDAVQALALTLGLVVAAAAAVAALGGVGPSLELASEHLTVGLAPRGATAPPSALELAEAWAIPILGSVTAQEIIQRTLAARSPSRARIAGITGGSMYLVVGMLPVAIGVVGPALVGRVPGLDTLEDPEQLLPQLARATLPAFGYVIFAGALVSAILSTIDSALLVASSLLSRNLLLAGREVSQRTRLLVARGGVAVFGVVAWLLAQGSERIFDLIEEASALGSAGVVVAVGFGLFTRVGGARSAAAALVVGTLVYAAASRVPHAMLGQVPALGALLTTAPYLASVAAALLAYLLAAPGGREGRGRDPASVAA